MSAEAKSISPDERICTSGFPSGSGPSLARAPAIGDLDGLALSDQPEELAGPLPELPYPYRRHRCS
jgi:hypothetical protein